MAPTDPTESMDTLPAILPAGIIEVCLCHHIRRTARAVTRRFDSAFLPLGIKSSQYNILVAIAALAPVVTSDVAEALAMDRTTLSRNLGPLRRAGYLDTIAGGGRRPETLALSAAGRVLLRKASTLWQQTQRDLTQELGAAQAGLLLEMLSRIAGTAL